MLWIPEAGEGVESSKTGEMQQSCVSKVTVARTMVDVIIFYVDRLQSLIRSRSPNNPCGAWFGYAITLIASQNALSQLLQPAIVVLEVVRQHFGCHQQWCLCVLIHVRPCAYVEAVTLLSNFDNWHPYPSQTKILAVCLQALQTLLPCTCPAALPALPASLHLINPLLLPYPALPLLQSWAGNQYSGTRGLWTDLLATLIWKPFLGRKGLYLSDKRSPKNVCRVSGQKTLQCLLQTYRSNPKMSEVKGKAICTIKSSLWIWYPISMGTESFFSFLGWTNLHVNFFF